MYFFLNRDSIEFPPIDESSESIIAIGGDLSIPRILNAYRNGIFPWYLENEPILWHSPKERMIIFLDQFRLRRSFKKELKKTNFKVEYDKNFEKVIYYCRALRFQQGTWITNEMFHAYCELFKRGYAHSVEIFYDGKLAGGLYGVLLNGIFFGESMFYLQPNASKIALVYLVEKLKELEVQVLDCQVYTDTLASFGGVIITRKEYLLILKNALQQKDLIGQWV